MPTIIFLNGVSSAGKTSLAKQLQARLEHPYLHVQLDSFEDMMPDRYDEGGEFDWPVLFPKVLNGFHRSIAALAAGGNHLVVDHVMVYREGWPSSLEQNVALLREFPVYFIGVKCDLEELLRREGARGDRHVGTVARQLPRVHTHGVYDLEVDTTHTSTQACAERILSRMRSGPPAAFDRLRKQGVLEFVAAP